MKQLENITITDKYTLTNIEYYEKGYLAGYIHAMLINDVDFKSYKEYEVLYRIHDVDNGNDYTLVSVDYGWKIGNMFSFPRHISRPKVCLYHFP